MVVHRRKWGIGFWKRMERNRFVEWDLEFARYSASCAGRPLVLPNGVKG